MTIEKILTGGPKMDNFSLTVILRKLFSIPPTSKIELIGLYQGNSTGISDVRNYPQKHAISLILRYFATLECISLFFCKFIALD